MGLVKLLLGTDKLQCASCGKEVNFPFKKMTLWPQYMPFTWKWVKQRLAGDQIVERFCDFKCFAEFASAGRLKEVVEAK